MPAPDSMNTAVSTFAAREDVSELTLPTAIAYK
jgi:hypothetical protein